MVACVRNGPLAVQAGPKSRMPFDYDMVVLDELSSFKSWQSKRFRAFMKVRPRVTRVVGLTGTPAPNSLMDLFAEFKCLDMGERLGRFITQYRTGYFTPDKMNGQIVYSYKLLPGAEEKIYDKISDITISSTFPTRAFPWWRTPRTWACPSRQS